jgi:hypothetical protein
MKWLTGFGLAVLVLVALIEAAPAAAELVLVAGASLPDEFVNQIRFLPIS